MWRTQVREDESRIEAEKRIKYKGTARIRLKWLHFQWNRPRELDDKNVERLKADFRKDCRRLDEHNHIPAVIDQQSLDAAEELSGTPAWRMGKYPQGGYPELVFPAGYRVECLHGRHRIQAAKELRLEWWTVDLYLADVDPNLKTCLVEEYSNEKKSNDGEIYRKIRQYHFQQNLRFEWRWWSRLSPHGKRCLKQLLGHEELTAALDALCGIPGLWGGMRLHTWNTILAIKCDDLILHYLHHIKDVWRKLLQHDASALQYVDEVTVKALELRAPRVSTRDADELRGPVLGGTIFSAFSEQDRVAIWARLQAVDGLIPSLYALFENVNYLKALVDCMTRLVRPSPGDTVSTALFKAFSDTNQRLDRAVIQVTESSFASSPASSADRADLGVRQLYAYAMRHYLQMPRDLKGKELLARHTTDADRTVLREFADLAERLGFESPEIIALKEHPPARDARDPSESSKPLLVTDGAGVKKKRRCGLPSVEEYVEDRESLFINHLHDVDEEQGEGITSFFVRKSIYSTFFGKPSSLPLEELHPRDNTIEGQDLERPELARQALERQELERQALERQALERRELARQELQRQELEKQELERQALGRQDLERQALERQERQALERQELQRQELEKQELERQELERQEGQALERQELERQELEKQELEKQERQELERRELARQALERQELERRELARQELEKQELERQELERQELGKQELKKQELERRDQEEKAKQQETRRTQARKEHHGRLQKLKLKKIYQGRPGEQAQEREERERSQIPSLEDERRLEDQQRIGLDELLDIDQDVDLQPEEDIHAESSGPRLEEAYSNTTVRINFKLHDGGIWKPAPAHTIERSDSFEIEKVAMNWVRGKWRLFNTELRMLAPQQCYDAVIADGTYTILLIRESEIDIDNELLLSAMDIGIEAKEQGRCFKTQEDLEEEL